MARSCWISEPRIFSTDASAPGAPPSPAATRSSSISSAMMSASMREMRSRMRLSSSSGRPREVACHAMRLRMPSSRWQCPSPAMPVRSWPSRYWRRSSPGSLPHQVDGRHAHVFQPDFVDVAATVQRPDRTHADAGRSHVQQQHGNAALGARAVIGADQAEHAVGVLRQRGPGLLAVDHVLAAVALGAGRQRGQVEPEPGSE